MSRVLHFEIQAEDVDRAVAFYQAVFGWQVQDWTEYAGVPYFGVTTGEEGLPGINGAIMQRPQPNPEPGGAVVGAVLTVGTEDFDAIAAKVLDAGGVVALPKAALPGMAWQGYFRDTENNVFGVHQPDPSAS